MSGSIPPPPPGFQVEQRPPRGQRAGMFGRGTPAPAPVPSPTPVPSPPRGQRLRTTPVDGDTARLNARVYGIDAYESGQTMRLPDGSTVPVGQQAAERFRNALTPQTRVQFVGEQTYGRPVASFYNGEDDVAIDMLRQGLAVVEPQYLRNDPERLRRYQEAEAYARSNRLGAWSGVVARPSEYRSLNGAGLSGNPFDQPRPAPSLPQLSARQPTLWDRVTQGYDRATSIAGNGEIGNLSRWLADAVNLNDSYDAALGRGSDVEREARRDAQMRDTVRAERALWDVQDSANPAWVSGNTWGESAANFFPNLARVGAGILGDTAGNANPTYLIGGGSNVLRRMAVQGTVNAGIDAALQSNELRTGIIDQYNPLQTAGQFVVGGALQGGGELAGRGIRMLSDAVGDWWRGADAPAAGRTSGVDAGGAPDARPVVPNEQDLRTAWEVPDDVTITGVTADGRPFGTYPDGVIYAAAQVADVGPARGAPDAVPDAAPSPSAPPLRPVQNDPAGFLLDEQGAGRQTFATQREAARYQAANGLGGSYDIAIDGDRFGLQVNSTVKANGLANSVAARRAQRGADAAPADLPPLPPGFQLERSAGMAAEPDPSISGPAFPRQRDVIDVNAARTTPMGAPITEAQMRAASGNISPGDVLPVPSNEVRSLDEFAAASDGRYRPLPSPREQDELLRRDIPSTFDGTRSVAKRGPLDLVSWLRSKGGLRDSGGELAHMGLDNRSRSEDFARGEHRFGRLVDNENGMTFDDAAYAAWEAGYFPELPEPPTINDFLEAVSDTHRGVNRRFHPDDYAEIERYYQAQETRRAIERAADDGAPMVEDRGQPVTLADLEANTPPLSAFDELPGGQPDFAGNIRLGKLDTPQDIARALATSHARVGGFDNATRGRITQEETARLAAEIGMTPEKLLARRKGQAFNAEEALAARQILAKSGNELVNLARRVQRLDNPGDELLAEFQRAWVRHVAIQEQIAGATAEAGRALAQFRMMADSRNVRGEVLAAAIRGGGGPERLRQAADLIIEGEAKGKLNVEAARALKPTFTDKLVELWYNSLLSGPQTHVVNVLSNTMTALGQIPEHVVAAGIGAGRRAINRQAVDRVLFSELGARSIGLMSGFREGLGEFARALRTGEPSDAMSKVEARSQRAISGVKGEVIRVPTRLLAAEDELFKAMARRMELHGLAVREARKEGLRGDAARKRVAELILNPTDEMFERVMDYGRYLTFQRPLGPAGNAVSQFTQALPIFKLVLPFVRTPTNLLKFTAERSPFAPLLSEWRADFKAGGARRDLAVARSLVGTAFAVAVAEAAANGLITGGPPSDRQREALMRANGWQPYSIYWRGQYYSYQRLDPFAMTMGTAADFATRQDGMSEKQQEDAATRVVVGFMSQLSDKTWLSGVSDMVLALQDPDRYLDGFVNRLAGSLTVPTGVAQVARTMDPTMRARDNMGEAIQARVPGLSDNLLPQRDVLGREIVSQGGVGPDIFSPIWQSSNRDDPVLNELLRSRVGFDRPDRTVRGVRLTGPQYDRYQAETGRLAYPELAALIAPPEWRSLSHDDRQEAVRDVMRRARAEARANVLGGPPAARGAPLARRQPALPPPSALPPLPPGFEMVQ